MVLSSLVKRRWLAVFISVIALAGTVNAQTAGNTAPAATVPEPSVFKGYKPYTDEPIVDWKAANDDVARIGGWREYARQAQQPATRPAQSTLPLRPIAGPARKATP